jgi:hypothetical protein
LVVYCVTGMITAQPGVARQSQGELIDRLGAYLHQHESELSTVMADEHYQQSESRIRSSSVDRTSPSVVMRKRTLESEVAFLRLPGDREWFGVRHVRRVDGRDAKARELTAMLRDAKDIDRVVREIVQLSSQYNIGDYRTVNMPTVPLEMLHPRNRDRMRLRIGRDSRLDGVPTTEIRYQEIGAGGLISDRGRRPLVASGTAWVEPTGRLRRVTLELRSAQETGAGFRGRNELRVDFDLDSQLNIMVPREMVEAYAIDGDGEFTGRATYSNFRRFTTSARIVPQF